MNFLEQIVFSQDGGIDTDSDARAVARGDYRMFENCRLGQISAEGFCVVTSLGTIEIANAGITAADEIMGTGLWQNKLAIVYIVKKPDLTSEFWKYDIIAQTNTLCGTTDVEFFGKFYHFDIIDNIGKFTNGVGTGTEYDTATSQELFNPPFQLNFQKALDGDYPSIDFQVLDAVKWMPLPPVATYDTDQSRADNKLRRKLFRFRVQYIYENSEETKWSMWSNLALPTQSEFVSGTNWQDSSQDNMIELVFETGPNVVKKINVAVQTYDETSFGAETEFGIFLQLDKAEDSIGDNTTFTFDFYGGVSTKPISNADGNYDRLPLTARCQSLIENTRITYTNFWEGYDKIELDVASSYILHEIRWNPKSFDMLLTGIFANSGGLNYNYLKLDASSTSFQPGDVYYSNIVLANTQTVQLYFVITQEIYDEVIVAGSPINALFEIIAESFADQINAVSSLPDVAAYAPDSTPYVTPFWTIWDGTSTAGSTPAWLTPFTVRKAIADRQTFSTPSLKVGATHEFGIVYGDRAFRDGTVLTNEGMSLFVPWYSEIETGSFAVAGDPFTVSARLSINHVPPVWAKYYWIVARKATEITDFSQWVVNADSSNAAFLAEGNRYIISLDKYYLDTNKGASINHVPKKGDIARFVRKRLSEVVNPTPSAYIDTYFELEVQEYRPTGGNANRRAIVVERFDLTLIDPNTFTDQLIEIYTPSPSLDTDGNLFVAEWRDITEALLIGSAHTGNRHHSAPDVVGKTTGGGSVTTTNIQTGQDLTDFIGREINLTNINGDGQSPLIVSVSPIGGGIYEIELNELLIFDFAPGNDGAFVIEAFQIVAAGVSQFAAVLDLGYGDVYVRERNYATGYANPAVLPWAYWFIEDPHYSDYWLSDVHQMGRFEIESPYAKQIQRQSSIYSAVYFPGTQINGLSSFALDGENIQDLNPQYGEVVRTFVSGREEKTLKCIQERKENSIYIQHYPDEAQAPSGDLRVSNKTFAAWYPYKGNYGCSDTGGSVIYPDGTVYYYDRINGVFIHSSTNGQVVISERDGARDFKFRKKTKELTAKLNADPDAYIRSYVDVQQQEIGFCFAFSDGSYEIYTFDVLANRWRTKYTYNFSWFENFGQTLIGFGANNGLFVHNQYDSITLHGDSFIQRITCVSNDNPFMIKRYQDLTQRANETFSVVAYAEPNQSYDRMATEMQLGLISVYEGYSKVDYRKNRYTPGYPSEEASMNGTEDLRAHSISHVLSYDPSIKNKGSILFSIEVKGVLS